jgi:hypothetical protein
MKPSLFGRAITAEEVARLRAESGPTALVRLCGALIGRALGDHIGTFTLPEISERIHVPDGGVDARYTAPNSRGIPETGGLIGPGRTTFQFKYRDVTRAPHPTLVSKLTRSIHDDLARTAPACDRYVLLTNVDLTGSDRKRLVEAITKHLSALTTSPLVWGASELALQLNSAPHLRSLFVNGATLCTLDFALEELRSAYRFARWPTFQGRDAELRAIASFASEPTARLSTVFGVPYVGKTRLVIEALVPRASLVVWSSIPEGAPLELFRDLDSEDRDVILVVDRCDPLAAMQLAGHASGRRRLKTILIATGAGDRLDTGEGRALYLGPLGEDEALRVVREIVPGLSFRQASWLAEVAGGLPGLLLHAGPLAGETGGDVGGPADAIRAKLETRIAATHLGGLDSAQRQAIRVLALLPVVGVSEETAPELDAIARALGTSGDLVRQQLGELRDTGLVRLRGRFAEVLPPLLGDHLARETLADPNRLIEELALTLNPTAVLRFLHRLRDIDAPAVRTTISELLSPRGWFPDLAALARNARQLRALAPAAPREALQCLERVLEGASADELASTLSGDPRRTVVATLEELARRTGTVEGAARLLLALADAENDVGGGSAPGVFVEFFHWAHPEMTAPLELRADILGEAARESSARRRALVARACGEAFRSSVIALHRGAGPAAPEPPYRPSRADVIEYGLAILRVVETLSKDPDAAVREAARLAAVQAFRPLVRVGLLPDGLHELALQAFRAIERAGRDATSARERARVVTELELVVEKLGTSTSDPEPEPARTAALALATPLIRDLTERTTRDRLWQWVGSGSHRAESARLDDPTEATSRLNALAGELAADPVALQAHLDWLTGDEALHRSPLFRRLGAVDDERQAWRILLDKPAGTHWDEAFAAYCVGRASRDAGLTSSELDTLAGSPLLARGVVLASSWLLPGEPQLTRLVDMATRGPIPRLELAQVVRLSAPWRTMPPPDTERLLQALDDGTPEVREALLLPILIWTDAHPDRRGSIRDLGWSFLETVGPALRRERAHTWDSLATRLGADDPDRLRAVLDQTVQHLLRRGDAVSLADERPLSWKALKDRDPGLALEVVLHAAALPHAWSIAGELADLVDPARDRDRLLTWAKETGPDGVRFLADGLDPDQSAFWQLVPDLILGSPGEETGDILIGRLHTGSWSGSATGMIDRRLGEARKLEQHGEARIRAWAQRAVTDLEAWRRREEREDQEMWIWDYRIHRTDLERLLRKPDSPERLWAIGRLLKDAPERRVRELLSPDDVLAALPSLPHLDPMTRAKWEAWARHHGAHD